MMQLGREPRQQTWWSRTVSINQKESTMNGNRNKNFLFYAGDRHPTKENMQAMKPKTKKCFKVLGFTEREKVDA